jgi:hypothetical protein
MELDCSRLNRIKERDANMKFACKKPCTCGGCYQFSTYGDAPWPTVACTKCAIPANPLDNLSVSVTADRLIHRSKAELEEGDYSLSIVIGTMAVETFLTRMFLRLKHMDAKIFNLPSPAQEEEWKRDFPRSGGFSRKPQRNGYTGTADFVSKSVTGMTFDEFVTSNDAVARVMDKFPDAANRSAKQYFQDELFERRNRIAHWGYVNSNQMEAQLCLDLAVAIVTILKEMDRSKYGIL